MQQELILQIVILTVEEDSLHVYLPDSRLPSDSPRVGKTLEDLAATLFRTTIGIDPSDIFFEQLYTFSSSRDSKVIVTYYFLVPRHTLQRFHKKDWVNADHIRNSGEDADVISYAIQRFRWKIEYTNAVYSLLPDEFTLGELQKTYEAILGYALDKRNFRRKILSLGLLKRIGKKKSGTPARPAEMYTFQTRKPVLVKVFS